MPTLRVLVADPDLDHRLLVCAALERGGYSTTTARSAEDVMAALLPGIFEMLLIAAELPEGQGADCCRKVRETSNLPIVIYGPREGPVAATEAFAAGADDFAAKPLDLELLLARIQAIVRRVQVAQHGSTVAVMTRTQAGPLVVDHTAQRAFYHGVDLNLSAKELQILFVLTQNVGQLVGRRQLQHSIWGTEVPEESKTLDVHVSRLRKRLAEANLDGDLIVTLRNRGYLLSSAVADSLEPAGGDRR